MTTIPLKSSWNNKNRPYCKKGLSKLSVVNKAIYLEKKIHSKYIKTLQCIEPRKFMWKFARERFLLA